MTHHSKIMNGTLKSLPESVLSIIMFDSVRVWPLDVSRMNYIYIYQIRILRETSSGQTIVLQSKWTTRPLISIAWIERALIKYRLDIHVFNCFNCIFSIVLLLYKCDLLARNTECFTSYSETLNNTSKEFIKCRILHFLIMECCRYLIF